MFRGLLFAFQFLTIVPLTTDRRATDSEMKWAAACFPLVGFIVGAFAAACCWLVAAVASLQIAVLAGLASAVAVTGALHEDGFADLLDGLGSGSRQPDEVVRVMRDSRIGTFGSLGLIFLIGFKYALLASLELTDVLSAFVVAAGIGRWCALLAAKVFPGRRAGGMGASFCSHVSVLPGLFGTGVAALAGLSLVGQPLVPMVILSGIAALLLGSYCGRRLDGLTGDCLGAIVQIGELSSYGVLVWMRGG